MQILRKDIRIIAIVAAGIVAIAGIVTLCEVRRAQRMRAAVEQALEQNRSGAPFTSDTVSFTLHSSFFTFHSSSAQRVSLRRAVAYYEHPLRRLWTSPNDRLRAGYALGCVYRDLHEAPIALLTWEDAIAAADTTSADCDYATLFRVYGQMADVYRDQHLPEKQLEADSCFCKYALLAGDTLLYIRGQLLLNSVYYTLGDTAAIFTNSEAVRQQYLELGRVQEAAQVYPTPIHVSVNNGQYDRARKMMNEYEHNSGLFGADGFIIDTTRAQYHSYKGYYYLGIHEIDSAEQQFRHLLSLQSTAMSASRGLIALYNERGDVDSIRKYAKLFDKLTDNELRNSKNTAIILSKGMYDYNRQQKKAQNEEKKANRRMLELIVVVLLLFALSFISYYYKKKENLQKRVKELEYNKLADGYNMALKQLEETQNDIAILRQEVTKNKATKYLLHKKEEQVLELKKLVSDLKRQLKYSPRHDLYNDIKESEIVEQLHLICRPHFEDTGKGFLSIPPRDASDHEWDLLSRHTRIAHPTFYLFVNEHKLSDLEYKVCLLVRYGFKNPEIAILTASNKRGISNVRKSIAKELFDLKSAHELDDQLSKF